MLSSPATLSSPQCVTSLSGELNGDELLANIYMYHLFVTVITLFIVR